MEAKRYLQITAVRALSGERPLAADLELALKRIGGGSPRQAEALRCAGSGDLSGALGLLGFAPSIQRAIAARPSAAIAVDNALGELPSATEITARYRTVLFYLSLVAMLQAGIGATVLSYVSPFIEQLAGTWGSAAVPTSSSLLPVAILFGLAGVAGLVWSVAGARWLGRHPLRALANARLCTTCAALLRAGAEPQQVINGLSESDQRALGGLGASREDADALDNLAQDFVARARFGSERLATRLKINGTAMLTALALFLIGWVYVSIGQLTTGVGP